MITIRQSKLEYTITSLLPQLDLNLKNGWGRRTYYFITVTEIHFLSLIEGLLFNHLLVEKSILKLKIQWTRELSSPTKNSRKFDFTLRNSKLDVTKIMSGRIFMDPPFISAINGYLSAQIFKKYPNQTQCEGSTSDINTYFSFL